MSSYDPIQARLDAARQAEAARQQEAEEMRMAAAASQNQLRKVIFTLVGVLILIILCVGFPLVGVRSGFFSKIGNDFSQAWNEFTNAPTAVVEIQTGMEMKTPTEVPTSKVEIIIPQASKKQEVVPTATATPTNVPPTSVPQATATTVPPTATAQVAQASGTSVEKLVNPNNQTQTCMAPTQGTGQNWNPFGRDLSQILSVEQVGGGSDLIVDWTDWKVGHYDVVNAFDYPVYLAISSDKGDFFLMSATGQKVGEYHSGNQGFTAAVELAPGQSIQFSTRPGWNFENCHWNTWVEAYVYPKDDGTSVETRLLNALAPFQLREHKPHWVVMTADGKLTENPSLNAK